MPGSDRFIYFSFILSQKTPPNNLNRCSFLLGCVQVLKWTAHFCFRLWFCQILWLLTMAWNKKKGVNINFLQTLKWVVTRARNMLSSRHGTSKMTSDWKKSVQMNAIDLTVSSSQVIFFYFILIRNFICLTVGECKLKLFNCPRHGTVSVF